MPTHCAKLNEPASPKKSTRLLQKGLAFLFLGLSVVVFPMTSSAEDEADTGKEAEPSATSTGASSPGLEYLYHRRPSDGSAAARAVAMGDRMESRTLAAEAVDFARIEDPVARGRFDRFLAMAPVPSGELEDYRVLYDHILRSLSQGQTVEAWQQLVTLSRFQPIDAGVSWELAARIESIWNTDRATRRIHEDNRELRQEVDKAAWNVDVMADRVRQRDIELERQRRLARGGASPQERPSGQGGSENIPQLSEDGPASPQNNVPTDALLGKLQLTEEYLKSLEAKARIKVNEVRMNQLGEQARSGFADYVTTLYESRRYRHVVLAAEFYRRIFDEGEYPVSMARQVNTSLEIARDVANAVEAFNYRLELNEVSAAADRLQEAFMINEHHPEVLALPREEKRRVEEFMRRLSRMENQIEARDFAGLEELLEEMREVAPDFDVTKALAIVNAVKLESRLRLGRARMAAQQGDMQLAMEEFRAAAETWPGNPDLDIGAEEFFDSHDVQTRSLADFDRMVSEKNYRGIFENQLAFAPAMKDDADRQEQLALALETVKAAEMAIEKAAVQRRNGDVFGAWETVELAVGEYSEDVKLNSLRGELAGAAAEFVAALNKAMAAEDRGDTGFGLTWYAIAQRHYPPSQLANEGIERLTEEVFQNALSGESAPAQTSEALPEEAEEL